MPPPSSVRGPGPSLAAGGILLGGPSWRPPSRGLFLFWSRKAARSSRRWLPLLYPAATINQKLGQTSCIHDFPAKLSFLQKTAPFTAYFESKMIRSTHSKSRNHAKTHDYPLIHSDRFILLLFFNWKNQHRHDKPRKHLRDLTCKKRDFFQHFRVFSPFEIEAFIKNSYVEVYSSRCM